MLSASGLLYSWRSRAGRSQSDPDPGTDPLSSSSSASTGDAHPRHPRRYRNRRRRFIGRDPSGGLIFGPQLEPRRPSHIHHQTVTVSVPIWSRSCCWRWSGRSLGFLLFWRCDNFDGSMNLEVWCDSMDWGWISGDCVSELAYATANSESCFVARSMSSSSSTSYNSPPRPFMMCQISSFLRSFTSPVL